MADSVGSHEAKRHLPARLDRVDRGELITFIRRARPVAQLVPLQPGPGRDVEKSALKMQRFRDEHLPGLGTDLSIRDLIDEGHQFGRSPERRICDDIYQVTL